MRPAARWRRCGRRRPPTRRRTAATTSRSTEPPTTLTAIRTRFRIGVIHHGPPVDPYAGFTADQRAAQLRPAPGQRPRQRPGRQCRSCPAPIRGRWRSRSFLDLDGNGIAVTKRGDGGSVLIDVDDDGFEEETDWINPRDGILVLDRNGDGQIAGGHEDVQRSASRHGDARPACARRARCRRRSQDHVERLRLRPSPGLAGHQPRRRSAGLRADLVCRARHH